MNIDINPKLNNVRVGAACRIPYAISEDPIKDAPLFTLQSEKIGEDVCIKNGIVSPFFKASDGNSYNLLSEILRRQTAAKSQALIKYYKKSYPLKIIEKIKNFLGIGITYERIESSKVNLIEDNRSIKSFFEKEAGYKYTKENVEKFLKGEIKLPLEKEANEYLDGKLEIVSEPIATPRYYNAKVRDIRNKITFLTEDEKLKYDVLCENISDDEHKEKLDCLLKYEILLKRNEDGISVMDSLYKIIQEERASGIDPSELLVNAIELLYNPALISQSDFEIPEDKKREIAAEIYYRTSKEQGTMPVKSMYEYTRRASKNQIEGIEEWLDSRYGAGTCAAASLEYDLLCNNPAEFFRILERLTSTEKSLIKESRYAGNWDNKVLIRADEEAYVLSANSTVQRAKIKENMPDLNLSFADLTQNRNVIDIIMQSAFMNLASNNSYHSIADTRMGGAANIQYVGNSGLCEIEEVKARQILNNQEYLLIEKTFSNQKELLKILKENLDKNKKVLTNIQARGILGDVLGGHAVIITGYKTNIQGKVLYYIKDSNVEGVLKVVPEEKLLIDLESICISAE